MVRKYVVDEVIRWWRTAPQEARFLLVRRVTDESPKELTYEELTIAATAAELELGEVEGEAARAAGQRLRRS